MPRFSSRWLGLLWLFVAAPVLFPQATLPASSVPDTRPDWCRALPRPEYARLQRIPVHDSWFEVYQVAPAVYALYEPHQAEETIAYLILGRHKALLFDTGMGIADIKSVVAQLTPLPVIVLNSHTHNDHVGGNWQFDSVHNLDSAFARLNAEGSRADAQQEIGPGQICGTLPADFDPGAYSTRPWKIAAPLHDGERIDLGGRALEVLATPGHTPDSISLFDQANGLLFTGDTYYPGTIWLYRPETDLAAYAASIHRLAALGPQVRLVLGAHNLPVAAPSVLDDLVIAFASIRAHRAAAEPAGPGKVLYRVGDIAFLMHSADPAPEAITH